jgi:hypothetical protein
MSGGQALTNGAANYFTALEEKCTRNPDYEQVFNCLAMARENFVEAKNEAREGLVFEVAWALEAMSLYHYGNRDEFVQQADSIISGFGIHWQKLKTTFQRLLGKEVVQGDEVESLGLSHISAHSSDSQFEEILNGQ